MAERPAEPESWTAILDRLETEISLAFAGESSGWVPPADAGPVPPELTARAHRLLSAQLESAELLAVQRQTIGLHLNAVNSVPAGPQQPSRLLDTMG